VGHYGAIPVQRGEADLTALKKTFQTVKSEDSIGMLYIEGTRSRTGLSQGEEGSVYVGLKTNAVIVPVAIWGTRSWPADWVKQFRRPSIYVRFGQPFRFSHEGRKLPRDLMPEMTEEAMYRIAELLPSEWRGNYSDLAQATTKHLDFDIQWQMVRSSLPERVRHSFSI
jgi:1-acyl-sn-glycerol-3-phosphate acyltransferase